MSDLTSQMTSYDVVIIGAGTAGQTAYQQAIKHTDNILVVNHGYWNTTCARVGCMPSKLLATAAKIAHKSTHARVFGIQNQTIIDGKAVMQRVQHERDFFAGAAQQAVDQWPTAHKLQGKAAFIDANTLQVGQQIIHSKSTVIATGSTPMIPDGWQQLLGDRLLTSDNAFELPDLPKSMAVYGTGAIGLELAQAFARLGVKVYLFGRQPLVGGLSHPDLRQQATDLLGDGMQLCLGSPIDQVERVNDQVCIHYQQKQHTVMVDYLLCALGRTANLTDLQLTQIDHKYASLDETWINPSTRQLDDLPIFIAGDVASSRAIQHEAAYAGRIAGSNAAQYPKTQAQPVYAALNIVFTDPQMATIGQSHKQLLASNTPFKTGSVSFQKQGRARVIAENHGALYLFGCPQTKTLLGAEMLGPDAEHIAHLLAWAMQQQLTIAEILRMPFYHPTIEEGVRTALVRLARELS